MAALTNDHRSAERRPRIPFGRLLQHVILGLLITLAFVPFAITLLLSFRPSASIYLNFWQLPWPPTTANYAGAWKALAAPLLRSVVVCAVSIGGILALALPCAYSFARLKYAGRTVIYRLIMAVLLIPTVILLTPLFSLSRQLGLVGNLWGLVVYYIATGLPLSIFLLTPFLAKQDDEIFQAARIDGATETAILLRIAIPLAVPILATIAIMTFLNLYNDFIWPSLVLQQNNQTAMLALANFAPPTSTGFSSRPDVGMQTAGYGIVALPQLLVLGAGMRYFIQGLTSGAVK